MRLQGLAVLLDYFLFLINFCLALAHAAQPPAALPGSSEPQQLTDPPAL